MNRWGLLVLVFLVSSVYVRPAIAGDEKGDQQAAKAFKQYVSDLMVSFNADKHERVEASPCFAVTDPDRADIKGYQKHSYDPSAEYKIDVRKTDSLISPYVGVLIFNWNIRYSDCQETREKAQAQSDLNHSDSAKYRYTYAYQDGKWVPTDRDASWHGDAWESCADRKAKYAGHGYEPEFGCSVPN